MQAYLFGMHDFELQVPEGELDHALNLLSLPEAVKQPSQHLLVVRAQAAHDLVELGRHFSAVLLEVAVGHLVLDRAHHVREEVELAELDRHVPLGPGALDADDPL